MRIIKSKYEIRVYFDVTNSFNRSRKDYISIINLDTLYDNEIPSVNIPATGNMATKSIPEFLKAIELAGLIASGELVIK